MRRKVEISQGGKVQVTRNERIREYPPKIYKDGVLTRALRIWRACRSAGLSNLHPNGYASTTFRDKQQ